MRINVKDVLSGGIFMAAGLGYGINAYATMRIGSALNMGPGFFPIVLSAILVLVGTLSVGRGLVTEGMPNPFGVISWRAASTITIALVLFAALLPQLGLAPGVLMVALVTCLAKPGLKLHLALLTSVGVALFCALVFGFLIRVPLPLFGSLFAG